MKTTNFRAVVLLSAVICSFTAQAEYRIATVDINRIINESSQSKTARKALDEKSLQARKKLEGRRSALRSIEEKIKSGEVREDSKDADKFRGDAREYAREIRDTEEELKREFLKSNKELTDKALKIVRAYALKNKIDIVLDKGDKVRGPVLFGAESFDITDPLLKEID